MIQITPHMRILVATQAVDFRKGIDGLVRVCKDHLSQDPFAGSVFVFRNRPQTGIKILVYDGQGFWLCHKRLSEGRFRWWPSSDHSSSELEAFALQVLIAAGNPEKASAAEPWKRLEPAGSYLESEGGVPDLPLNMLTHDYHDISRQAHHRAGCRLHPRADRKLPGIQPS